MSFLRDYAIISAGNESPNVYHQWAALSTLSSLISRRVWVDQGVFRPYPNMYVFFVGDAGVKKSTAMNIARKLIREIQTIPIAAPSVTKEALTQLMAEKDSPCKKNFKHTFPDGKSTYIEYCHVSMFCNELVTMLNAGGNAAGMVDFLTDIWDQDIFEIRTKHQGNDNIIGPYLTVLGCLTTDVMSNLMNSKIISGGFARRCIFVWSDDIGAPIYRPIVTDAQKEAWTRCIKRAQELQSISGEFTFSPAGDLFYKHWYEKHHYLKATIESPLLKGFYNSKAEYVLKIAMLVTLSESNILVLEPEALEIAVAYIDTIEPGMTRAFEGTGRNELSPVASNVERFVNANTEPVSVKRVYGMFYKDAKTEELREILEFLNKVGKIKLYEVNSPNGVLQLAAPKDYVPKPGQQVTKPEGGA